MARKLTLFQHTNFGGWGQDYEISMTNIPPSIDDQVSSVKVYTPEVFIFHDKSWNRGSHLIVRFDSATEENPGLIPDLTAILKQNGFLPPNDWNDEISSFEIKSPVWRTDGDDLNTVFITNGLFVP